MFFTVKLGLERKFSFSHDFPNFTQKNPMISRGYYGRHEQIPRSFFGVYNDIYPKYQYDTILAMNTYINGLNEAISVSSSTQNGTVMEIHIFLRYAPNEIGHNRHISPYSSNNSSWGDT